VQEFCLHEIALECAVFVIHINHMQILFAKNIFEEFQVALLALSMYKQNITSYFIRFFAPKSCSLSRFIR